MSKKRTKKDYAPHVSGGKAPRCEAAGCTAEGEYKAPRSRHNLHEYRYLCLEHVREHNKAWDYFSGMNPDEIEAFMKDAVTGHRPTWERTAHMPNTHEALYAAVNDFVHMGRKKTKDMPRLSPKIKKAVALFELDYPYSVSNLKKRYKDLARKFHPDRNQGDKLAEEKFKAIAEAYKVLHTHIHPE